MLLISGCAKSDPDEFIREYRQTSEAVTNRNGFRVSTMVMSPDYMAALRLRGGSKSPRISVDSLKESFSHSIFVRLSVSYQDTGGTGKGGGIVNPAASQGRQHFSKMLNLYQSGMRDKCVLELENGEIQLPSTYALERDWGLSDETSFIFIFPKSGDIPGIDGKATLLVKEFGLALGNIRHPFEKPRAMRLRI